MMKKTAGKTGRDGMERRAGLWIVSLVIGFQVAGLILFSIATPVPVEAKTFTVNSTDDAVDEDFGDGSCATAGGECTLRAAIQQANALAGADTIKLKAGLYVLTLAGASENDCATGDLDITENLTLIGVGEKKTFINGEKLDRVFHIIAGISVTMTDMTIQNGLAADDGSGDVNNARGGGILNESASTLTLKGITLSNNAASGGVTSSGGGIYNSGTLTITKSLLSNSTLSNNAAWGGSGGVAGGAVYNNGTLKVKATTIFNNIAMGPGDGYGGGIMNYSNVEIKQSIVSNNTVSVQGSYGEGGGINNNGTTTIIDSTISNNTAQGVFGDGGGIANGGDLTITTSVISSNIALAPHAGGAGIATFWGNVVITGSTLSNNAASGVSGNPGRGGGIFLGEYTAVTLQGASKILRNFASDAGGGICYGGAGSGSISADSTVAKNIPDDIYPTQ
jgi:CSLREA domain-containing protein